MFLKINNYDKKELLAKVSFSQQTNDDLIAHGFNVLYIYKKDKISLLINNTEYSFNYSIISDGLYEYDVVSIYQNGYVNLLFSPDSFSQTLFITNKCNSNCVMCPYSDSVRKKPMNFDINYLLNEVNYIPDETKHITITGGEPTLIGYDFFELMSAVKHRFPTLQCLLLTNGRSFSIDKFCRNASMSFPDNTIAAIPVHSYKAEIHDYISRAKGSFSQTIKGIQKLSNIISIEIRIVVTKLNIGDMMGIAKLIVNNFKNIHVVNFMAAEMCGNAAINKDLIWINYNEAFKNCLSAVDYLVNNGINVGIYNFPLCSVPEKYWGLYKKSISHYKIKYAGNCGICTNKEICGGIFNSSIRYAQSDIIPYMR